MHTGALQPTSHPLVSDDLAALIRAVPGALVELSPLRRADAPRVPASAFRLRFADGSRRKARVCALPAQAARIETLIGWLAARLPIPRVLARHGTALLTEWVDGESLDLATLSAERLRACADLRARVHTVPVPPACPWTASDAARRWRRFGTQLDALVAAGALAAPEAAHARAIAEPHAATAFATGCTHRDFCAENFVVDAAGRAVIVDNETVGIDALDFDLARTWYRWPMLPAQREAYLSAYARHRDPAAFLVHFTYWAILVLVDSAYLRLAAAPGVRAVPVQRLRALLATATDRRESARLAVQS
jgi:aminoglycoside phosphotransferase